MEDKKKVRYCLYARKSSEQDERQAMSIDSQLKEMVELAQRDGLKIVEVKQESHSAKQSGKRPVFMKMLEDIRNDRYNGILTWAPDRLSRNAGDLGSLVDLMDSKKLAHIKTHSQEFSNNPNEKFLLMILCSQAKLENDNRAINVKRGIRAKCEMGWRPCMPPLGYHTRAATGSGKDIIIDSERAPHIVIAFGMSAKGIGGRSIKQYFIENDVKTRKGKTITLSMVYKILKNSFYYGDFEYPIDSGNWYQGKHESLITKELFDEVQKQLIVPQKGKWGSKEFPYRRFIKCGSCGASVVGTEKIKNLQNGKTRRHVYYHCSRQVDYNCKEPYVREEAILREILKHTRRLINDYSLLDIGLRKSIEKYISISKVLNPDLKKRDYVTSFIEYTLMSGTYSERVRLVANLDINFELRNRSLVQKF